MNGKKKKNAGKWKYSSMKDKCMHRCGESDGHFKVEICLFDM